MSNNITIQVIEKEVIVHQRDDLGDVTAITFMAGDEKSALKLKNSLATVIIKGAVNPIKVL